MILKVFAVYDSAGQAYIPPWYVPTTGLAIRSFTTAANNPDHDFCKHGADYTLFEIGTFDDNTGRIDMYAAYVSLGKALEFNENWRASKTVVDIDSRKKG